MANPITWADMDYAKKLRTVIRYDESGDEVIDKYPMTAPAPEGHPLYKRRFVRWVVMVDSAGNVKRPVLTEASSNYDLNSSYAQYMRARWRNEGWLPYGDCPKMLAASGAINPKHLLPTNKNGTPCERGTFDNGEGPNAKGPCPCMRAEVASRRARNLKEDQRRAKRYESELARESKEQTEAAKSQAGSMQAMVQQQAEQNKALTEAMMALAGISKAKADKPKKGKKAAEPVEEAADELDEGVDE